MPDQPAPPLPPAAPRVPTSVTLHGHTLTDDYAWMRDKSSPALLSHLTAENAYTAAVMAPTAALQQSLYAEMLSHIKETDESVPYPNRGYTYFVRTVEGSQYPIYCRRPEASPDSPAQILLDVNFLAAGQPYMAVGSMEVSPDGHLLAYTTDNTGFRQYTLHIRDLRTALASPDADLPDTALRVGSLTWAADSQTLLYTTEDEVTKRHDKLFRHILGQTEPDTLLLTETDERFNLGVGATRDREFLLIESGSHTANEVSFLPAADPFATPILIAPRADEHEYYPDHRDGLFYIRTNDTSKDFRLVTTPAASPARANWSEIFAPAPNTPLEDFDLFATFCVLTQRVAGLPTLTLYSFTPSGALVIDTPHELTFPEPTYSAAAQVNREFASTNFRYSYQSLVSPASVYQFDTLTQTSTLLKQQEVPGGFDPALYASERIWINAPAGPGPDGLDASDGLALPGSVKVPVSLVYRRNLRTQGTNPLYVYGYGSYGFALPMGFNPTRLALLDRGIVLAYAHIRGGGDLGDPWHDAGKMALKANTFTDFIAVIESLVQQGYGAPGRVAIEGGSAGGLLLGAVLNQRPDLVRVAISHVPFVDVMNTMLDSTLPLTVAEYEEWGNPNEPAAFRTMLAYSPYDNLRPAPYPAMLVKTSLNDSQVMYWEPAKYVAKLRTLNQSHAPLLFHINMQAGHGGASGRYDYLKEIAFDYAFLLTQLAIE